MDKNTIKFYVWNPEDHPELLPIFISCKKEAERINNLNPNLIRKNKDTWVSKEKEQ